MKRLIRGMAGLAIVLGASACAEDYSLDFGGEPTQLQATPYAMFINQGVTEEVYVRLINDRNQSIPMDVTVSNVGSGITVEVDRTYRPDNAGSDSLAVDPLQIQHRVLVTADAPTKTTFRLTSGSHSTDVTVQVVPNTIGALSNAAPGVGEEVTITAPGGLSFTTEGDNASTVTFATGGAALITNRTATTLTFIPIPGSSGEATVTHVTMDYAPTLGDRSLTTSNEITVPAVTEIPLAFGGNTPLTPVTVTATGFRFTDDFSLTIGGRGAWVTSVAGDGTSATVILPHGLAGEAVEVSGVELASLAGIALSGLEGTSSVTTNPAAPAWSGANPDGTAPVINAAAAGTPVVFYDTGDHANAWGADVLDGGGPNKWYKLVIPSGGSRTVTVDWNSDADMDFLVTDEAITTAYINRGTTAHPEFGTANLAAGTYWIGLINWGGGTQPGILKITVE